MASEPLKAQPRINLGEGIALDPSSDELHRNGRVVKLERIPAAVLLLLVERRGQVVKREDIVEKVWGKDVFLDTDNGINGAIRKIRQALKDDPTSPRFIQTISGKGYRFVGQMEPTLPDSGEQPESVSFPHVEDLSPITATAAKPWISQKRIRASLVIAGIGLIAIIGLSWLLIRNRARTAASPPIRSLAVLPLKNLSSDASQDYLADGMTESIIGRLSGIRELRVISRTSSMRFTDTKLSVPEIARQLNVDAIVEGSVIRDGTRIRVHAQLIRAASDEHFWSETYDREFKDVLSLQSDVAQSIAEKVQVTLTGSERVRLASVSPVPPEVYENYLKGRYTVSKTNSVAEAERSLAYFQRAIEKDPTFAPAYVGLSVAYNRLGSIFIAGVRPEEVRPKAMAALRKALELDPQSIEAHLELGQLEMVQWQWSDAEAEFRHVLELDPNSAAAHHGMAFWLSIHGRTEEGLAWARRGRELDPFQVSDGDIGWLLFLAHHFPEALEEERIAVSVDEDNPGNLWFLGYTLIANGHPEQAIAPMEKGLAISNRSPGIMGVLIRAYAHAGRRADALRLLDELKRRQKSGYVPSAAFINAYLGLDDREQAFAALEQGYKEHSNIMQYLKVHPHFDPLRNDPRFKDLLQRVGLN